jgi:hypothetical protein
LCRLLAVEARTAHDRFGLTHISILHASGDIGNLNHNLRSTPIATCRDQCAMRSRASPSPHAQHEFKRHNFKQRILRTLNLEDTPRMFRAFAIERSGGVSIPATMRRLLRRSTLLQGQPQDCIASFTLLQQPANDAHATRLCRGALRHQSQKLARRSPVCPQ